MYYAPVNGTNVYYDRLGSGQPLVLIHGLGERKEGWVLQHSLSEYFDVIIPDLRGFGETLCPKDQEISMNAFAKDIIGLLDHLGIDQAHILGFSMGGIISQEIYKIRPEKVKSFILASTVFYIPKWLEKLLLMVFKRFETMTVDQFKRQATFSCLYDKSDEMVQKVMPVWSNHLDGFMPSWRACLHIDYRETLKTISVPTLVISCQQDKICPAFFQKRMKKLIPDSMLYTIKKAGHMGKIEKVEEFNREVLKFLL
ncbi:alpha/beta fold hydrolase [Neobacillus dielmonensis]|uniref:alpha/beta fold hydrolase n=1 Tax=Neobacillus dielmonensis TaxID=1347369 RepID=UPI0005A85253|nr:alpha/beta hydrolase [Neobacillus dielmonensis]